MIHQTGTAVQLGFTWDAIKRLFLDANASLDFVLSLTQSLSPSVTKIRGLSLADDRRGYSLYSESPLFSVVSQQTDNLTFFFSQS